MFSACISVAKGKKECSERKERGSGKSRVLRENSNGIKQVYPICVLLGSSLSVSKQSLSFIMYSLITFVELKVLRLSPAQDVPSFLSETIEKGQRAGNLLQPNHRRVPRATALLAHYV